MRKQGTGKHRDRCQVPRSRRDPPSPWCTSTACRSCRWRRARTRWPCRTAGTSGWV